jgi:hypothetical protein
MRPLHGLPDPNRRGAALLLSFLVLMVIIAIVYQLNRVTGTDQQVATKTLQLTKMDLAIRSALYEVLEQLREDGELRLEGGDEGGAMDMGAAEGAVSEGEEGVESNPDAVDCLMDEWAQVAATTIDDVQLRILIEDEDRKYNILNMLAEDEEMAGEAFERVARTLDFCREQTYDDISSSEGDDLARLMRDHMLEREDATLPRPRALLNDDDERSTVGLPLTMREFLALENFEEHLFRDYFDEDGTRVHAITAYLTCYTSPSTGGGGGTQAVTAEGGHNVNVNTAPLAVLMGLFDSRDINGRFWDSVLEYRNEEEDLPQGSEEEEEDILDEFGEPVLRKQFFDSLEEFAELPDWETMEPELRGEIETLLRVDSDVFSITITARIPTANERNQVLEFSSRREQEEYERSGLHLVRTVRAVYWRQMGGDSVQMIPLVPWEVLDYAPLPVLDLPEDGL